MPEYTTEGAIIDAMDSLKMKEYDLFVKKVQAQVVHIGEISASLARAKATLKEMQWKFTEPDIS